MVKKEVFEWTENSRACDFPLSSNYVKKVKYDFEHKYGYELGMTKIE